MAQIVTITNPLTGQPAQVDQLDHTAQQIDDAIARALPGGYYDKWVSQLPGQNLLDNWYFGNPVDQRQGRVVKPNTTYYSDNTLATAAGTTSAYVTAYRYATGTASGVNYASFKLEDSDTAPTYYAAPENVVRGYVSPGYDMYSFDRYIIGWGMSATLEDDGILLTAQSGRQEATINFQQKWPDWISAIDGKIVTVSILYKTNTSGIRFGFWDNNIEIPVTNGNFNCLSFTRVFNHNNSFAVSSYTPDVQIKIEAAKLELGSQQTLAHQDENGNWQLNEIPDYGEQLARCQRYCLVIGRDDTYCPVGTGQARTTSNYQLHIPLPVSLRTFPTITKIGKIWVRNQEGVIYLTSLNFQYNLSQNCISLECSGESAFTPGTFYESFTIPGGKLVISADL